jgi:hypothetical protein
VVSSTLRPLFTPGKDPVPIVQEAGWAPGPFWTGAENLAPTEIRSPDRPARSSVAIPTELPGPHFKRRAKKKRIPYIFKDESTGSCICLSRHIYMLHV